MPSSLFASQVDLSLENVRLLKETKRNYLDMMKPLSAMAEAKGTRFQWDEEGVD